MEFDRTRRRVIEGQIESCRGLIERQRNLIAENKARGLPTGAAENLLAALERSQAMFEEELATIGKPEA